MSDDLTSLISFFDTTETPASPAPTVLHPSLPPHHQNYDFKNPDIAGEMARRQRLLIHLRENPDKLPGIRAYYRKHPADWCADWCMTYDPRLKGVKSVPFVLMPRQREWIDWVLERRANDENGITPKSRELGMSWLAMMLSVWMCLFEEGVSIGFGSQVKSDVDNSQNPDSLFWKGRFILENLPVEFTGGWTAKDNAIDMQMRFPATGGMIAGDCGDDIGRGGRKTIFFVDEAAHLDHPELAEASLSATTNCRIDISSVRGSNNPFGRKMTEGHVPCFQYHWRQDMRKDDAWYAKMCEKYDPVTIAQEVDIDISASVEGIVIPAIWVRAAIDAHKKLGITPAGTRTGSFDVADEGRDDCAFAGKHGILLEHMEVWKGKGSDIFDSVKKVFSIADLKRYPDGITYDGDGLGSGVRGDARVINAARVGKQMMFAAFRGSAAPDRPEGSDVEGRKNKEMFLNKKAQGWWALRCRFERTYKWVTAGVVCPVDDIISLSRELPGLQQLVLELSQPTYTTTTAGRILIDKQPEGSKSPNRGDAVMLAYAGSAQKPLRIDPAALARMGVRPGVMAGMRGGRLG
jgi:phage terminase large subunit